MNEARKTVVIISPAFPENESATYWVPSQQLLVKALKDNFPQYDFEVLALLYPYQKSEYRWHNIPVTSYNGVNYPGVKRLSLWWKVWGKLKRIRREKKLAGILSFWFMEAALVGSYFARRNKLPHFCWLCGQDARKTNRYVKLIRPRAHELVAISDFVAAEFYRNHKVKPAHVIPNAIDEKMFPRELSTHRDIDILGVGALIPLKQFDILIEVAGSLRKHFPHIKVKICGIGEERKRLMTQIRQQDLQNNIEMTGALKHEEVLALMQRTRLLVHPSEYEGFSTVCLEAIYAGARVISFVQPMNHEIKNWFIARSADEMAEKALQILRSALPPERIASWSIDDIAKRMMHLFDPNA
jgi:glycosyltransferase involved in cell wall biosynthesis